MDPLTISIIAEAYAVSRQAITNWRQRGKLSLRDFLNPQLVHDRLNSKLERYSLPVAELNDERRQIEITGFFRANGFIKHKKK